MFESQNVSLIDSSLHKAICYMVIDEVVDEVLKWWLSHPRGKHTW